MFISRKAHIDDFQISPVERRSNMERKNHAGKQVDAIMYYDFRDIPIVFTAGWKGKTDDVASQPCSKASPDRSRRPPAGRNRAVASDFRGRAPAGCTRNVGTRTGPRSLPVPTSARGRVAAKFGDFRHKIRRIPAKIRQKFGKNSANSSIKKMFFKQKIEIGEIP